MINALPWPTLRVGAARGIAGQSRNVARIGWPIQVRRHGHRHRSALRKCGAAGSSALAAQDRLLSGAGDRMRPAPCRPAVPPSDPAHRDGKPQRRCCSRNARSWRGTARLRVQRRSSDSRPAGRRGRGSHDKRELLPGESCKRPRRAEVVDGRPGACLPTWRWCRRSSRSSPEPPHSGRPRRWLAPLPRRLRPSPGRQRLPLPRRQRHCWPRHWRPRGGCRSRPPTPSDRAGARKSLLQRAFRLYVISDTRPNGTDPDGTDQTSSAAGIAHRCRLEGLDLRLGSAWSSHMDTGGNRRDRRRADGL